MFVFLILIPFLLLLLLPLMCTLATSCRGNAKGFDLNRNFPDYFKQNTKRPQPETEAVKDVSFKQRSAACILIF